MVTDRDEVYYHTLRKTEVGFQGEQSNTTHTRRATGRDPLRPEPTRGDLLASHIGQRPLVHTRYITVLPGLSPDPFRPHRVPPLSVCRLGVL